MEIVAAVVGAVLLRSIGGWLFNRIQGRRSERNQMSDVVELALKDPTGQSAKLFRRWRHGRALVEPGCLTVELFAPLGLRIRRPFSRPIAVRVTGVSEHHRTPAGLEHWFVSGRIFEIRSDGRPLEMAISHTSDAAWVLAQLGFPMSSASEVER